jgi:hypothetical protein
VLQVGQHVEQRRVEARVQQPQIVVDKLNHGSAISTERFENICTLRRKTLV